MSTPADALRAAMPVEIDGPLAADILETLQMILAEECPICGRYDYVCGRCSVRSYVVRELSKVARNQQ